MLSTLLELFAAIMPLGLSILTAIKAKQVAERPLWKLLTIVFGIACTILVFWQQYTVRAASKVEKNELNGRIAVLTSEISKLRVEDAGARSENTQMREQLQHLGAQLERPLQTEAPTPCPDSLQFTLRNIKARPEQQIYEAEISIKKPNAKMFRVRIFARTLITASILEPEGRGISAATYVGGGGYSVGLSSTLPTDHFKARLKASEGIRIKCVNEDN